MVGRNCHFDWSVCVLFDRFVFFALLMAFNNWHRDNSKKEISIYEEVFFFSFHHFFVFVFVVVLYVWRIRWYVHIININKIVFPLVFFFFASFNLINLWSATAVFAWRRTKKKRKRKNAFAVGGDKVHSQMVVLAIKRTNHKIIIFLHLNAVAESMLRIN